MATIDGGLGPTTGGLDEAAVRRRVEAGQVNVVADAPTRTTGDIIRANTVTRFNILLGVMLVIVLVVLREPRDALFGIVLFTNAAIGIIQELRAKRTLDRLELLAAPRIRVVRSGRVVELPAEEIVLDDLIELRSGDQIAVDGVVATSEGLEIDESLLTGESDPVRKREGDECLSGSFVAAGTGRCRATRIGSDAYAARLAQEAKQFTLVRSELRIGIDWILAAVSWAAGPMIVLIAWSQMRAERSFFEALGGAVAATVAMIPQGLVLLTSVAFAVGVIRLGRSNVLVQELPAIEGLARVDTVCFDKTGTLTEGRMAVLELTVLDASDPEPLLAALSALDPDPNATLAAVAAAYPAQTGAGLGSTVAVVPFSSARKWSGATFVDHGTWVLGAPDVVAPTDGDVAELAESAAGEGRRMLLLATAPGALSGERLPPDLRPVAMLALGDQIRSDAAETLRYFADQGVAVKVISGDHPGTVGAIARQVGVVGSQHAVDARYLPEDPDELSDVMESSSVFGRVTPHQKRAMVGALQARGHVVAMTGDGVNDVLALKDSDIGIAVGSGAPASRSVAQLVLIDGRFATLPGIVAEGRRVISNIERVANLVITSTVYAVGLAMAIVWSSLPFPFLPRHLTLVGSLTVGIPAFFLALAPSARRARPGFLGRVLRFAVPTGLAATLATFAAYQLAISEDVTLEAARTTATLVLTGIGMFALGIVSRPLVPWKRWLIAGMVGLLILAFASPLSREFFELELPALVVLLAAVGIAAITGTLMMLTLHAVGWVRTVPDILREHPPTRPASWQYMSRRIGDLSGWHRSSPLTTEIPTIRTHLGDEPADAEPQGDARPGAKGPPVEHPAAVTVGTDAATDDGTPAADRSEPETAETPLGTIQWYDPDDDLPRRNPY